MQQAILWDDGCKVQTLIDEGYDVTTVCYLPPQRKAVLMFVDV